MERCASMDNKELTKLAVEARENSYSPYSNFMVGAALITKDGRVFTGCNIENAGYSSTICAERTAFFKAVSEGEMSFEKIAVAGWAKDAKQQAEAFPCGVCRQVMREFCEPDTFKVLVVKNESGDYTEYTLGELLPFGFGPENLI
jgi:cytidine deaminase